MNLIEQAAAEFKMRQYEADTYRKIVEYLLPLHDKRELQKAIGVRIGDSLHDGIPKLIELAEECLRLRKDVATNCVTLGGTTYTREFLQSAAAQRLNSFGMSAEAGAHIDEIGLISGNYPILTAVSPEANEERRFRDCPSCGHQPNMEERVFCKCGIAVSADAFAESDALDLWNSLARR